jgi:hypothetical protein
MSCLRHECTQEQEMRVFPVILGMFETTQRFDRNLNLDVDDPEEILIRCSGRNGKTGLWFLLGVVHYNMDNYKVGSITEITDGFRKIKWQRKKEVE